MQIGVLSDTHGYMDKRILHHLKDCDVVLHAGDVGNVSVLNQLQKTTKLECVYGNIDGAQIRSRAPEFLCLNYESERFLMIHIAGAFPNYNKRTKELIEQYNPTALVCGHSHILCVKQNETHNLLHINPGAAGRHGFHKTRTMLKLSVSSQGLSNLRVVELGSRSTQPIY